MIGAHAVGRQFALAAALAGYAVVFEDVSREMLERGTLWIGASLEKSVARAELNSQERDLALARIVCAHTVEAAIREADLIFEAVPEELEMKLELFTIFDKFAKPGAIFVTTTSTMSVLDLSDVTVCRERCVGMRFRDGGIGRGAIELVRTKLTSEETVRVCREVAGRFTREVLDVEDSGAAT
ncbi:MAG: 3-hydroxyacyl-CoA dehydrogenase NAD-binding domain-containing protein [Candidatus Acidiferrum sp.]